MCRCKPATELLFVQWYEFVKKVPRNVGENYSFLSCTRLKWHRKYRENRAWCQEKFGLILAESIRSIVNVTEKEQSKLCCNDSTFCTAYGVSSYDTEHRWLSKQYYVSRLFFPGDNKFDYD